MIKRLPLIFVLLFVTMGLHAQVGHFGAGGYYSFVSTIKVESIIGNSYDTELLYANTYTPMYGGTVFFDVSESSVSSLFEASYLVGNLDSVQQGKQQLENWDPSSFNSLKTISLYYYQGINFLSGHRFQIPIYIGVGGNYNIASPIKGFVFNLAAKARIKLYITDRICLFGGGGWKGGLGTQGYNEDKTLLISQKMFYGEGGFSFCF